MADTKEKDRAPVAPPLTKRQMSTSGDTSVELLDDDVEITPLLSGNIISDASLLVNGTPLPASQVNANNPNGPILDIMGNNGLVLNHAKEASALLNTIKQATDAADPMLIKVTGVYNALTGAGSPSVQLLTDLQTAIATGPTPATATKACAPAGPILDWVGNLNSVNIMLKEMKNLLNLLNRVFDAADPMKAQAANITAALV
jgi:hypothetical protein